MDYWQNYWLGNLMPETAQFINSTYRKQDFLQFNKDFKKNTGRTIKYPHMRGYDPESIWREYGAEGGKWLNSMFSTPVKAWKKGLSNPVGGTVRNMMDL